MRVSIYHSVATCGSQMLVPCEIGATVLASSNFVASAFFSAVFGLLASESGSKSIWMYLVAVILWENAGNLRVGSKCVTAAVQTDC